MVEQLIPVDRLDQVAGLFGNFDENVKILEKEYDVTVSQRGTELKISGETGDVTRAARAVQALLNILGRGETVSEQTVRYVITLVDEGSERQIETLGRGCICVTARGQQVKAKTLGQKKYVELVQKETITLSIGPAGTGKTYLAVALAVAALRAKEVGRIILTRPAVEAGEKLGFLPGDLQNKVNPYLRPLYDALFEMLGQEGFQKMQERQSIEVAPLAYMRGRTLDESFIILDEAQNTTPEQMKMFLTRLGFRSKAVITGDVTQTDLPPGSRSGLTEAAKVLRNIDGIGIQYLTERDVVRHPLVQKIIQAYARYESGKNREAARGPSRR